MNTPSDSPADGFSYSRAFFEELVDSALGHAKKLGATDAGAEASEGCGLSVSVRKGEIETVERNRDKSLGVTVYLGSRRGNASTSDFSKAAIAQTVQAAYDIARFTAEDPIAGLPDEADVATEHRDLDLFHPWAIDSAQAAALALECEQAALATSKRITNSEGAGVCPAKPIFSAPTPTAFAVATPARAIRFRSHPLPARAATCSAMPGTARCAMPASWPRRRPWAATRPSVP